MYLFDETLVVAWCFPARQLRTVVVVPIILPGSTWYSLNFFLFHQ